MKLNKNGLKYGIWNTSEHILTKLFDVGLSFLLISLLSTKAFGALAYGQALVAPILLFFIAPSGILYREVSQWKSKGRSYLAKHLRALRIYGVLLAVAALGFSFLISIFYDQSDYSIDFIQRVSILFWSISLLTALHWSGADREFLRIELELVQLNIITFIQKLIIFFGSFYVIKVYPERYDLLALVSLISFSFANLSVYILTKFKLKEIPDANFSESLSTFSILKNAFKDYSAWHHFCGVVLNWVITMDLFFLGIQSVSSHLMGLYAVSIRVSNLTLTLPMAFASLFQVWLSRQSVIGTKKEFSLMYRSTVALTVFSALQALVVYFISPWVISLLSGGKWSVNEQAQIVHWLSILLVSGWIYQSLILITFWILVRSKLKLIALRLYGVWLVVSVILFALGTLEGLTQWTPWLKVICYSFYGLILLFYYRLEKTNIQA